MSPPSLRIGVDVGGTNTDGVILDPAKSAAADRGIVAWKKSSTTTNPSDGIFNVISEMFTEFSVDPAAVASVTIGTTHFINAVVEHDAARLNKVGVIRISGPFGKPVPLGIDWPSALGDIVCGHVGHVKGGLEIDGTPIARLDEDAVRAEALKIKEKGITNIVVIGVFSPIDIVHRHEERAAAIVNNVFPEATVTQSKDVANIGFFERENAAVLNASILSFAAKTISSFQAAIAKLKLSCPVFLTQNDGTIVPASSAARLPIRTFSSGPTNSMRGAAFLTQSLDSKEAMMVVDIGGTTTDVGLLLANGFPRQAAAYSDIAGVRTNFSYPDVKSIGLGGGSIIRKTAEGKMTIGPDSVGYDICRQAVVFGGPVTTTTDFTALADESIQIGDRSRLSAYAADGRDLKAELPEVKAQIKSMLERIIDTMKTSADDIPVVLVGGGAVIAPDALNGASRVIKPNWAGVANAIGAATARVSGIVDMILSTENKSLAEATEDVVAIAKKRAVENGALEDTVEVAELESFPLQYVANKSRVIAKAVGDFDFSRTDFPVLEVDPEILKEADSIFGASHNQAGDKKKNASKDTNKPAEMSKDEIAAYRPKIVGREWFISETDLIWISCGCYILGTGGGGSPYQHMLRLRESMRKGHTIRVMSPFDLSDDAVVACGGGKGSPQVSIEKPCADEVVESQRKLIDFMGVIPHAVIDLEIGGGNGLQAMCIGHSGALDIPVVDGDWMGRAYPVSWQTTPVVYEEKAQMLPTCMTDGNGRVMFMTEAETELQIEQAFRAALATMGSHVGCAKGPVSGANTKKWVVANTISLAWRIGRAVFNARASHTIDTVAEDIINEVGGSASAKVLFKGKIVAVERVTRAGHAYGEVTIASTEEGSRKVLKIPFKNENILAKTVDMDSGAEEVVCVVPDLITVLDSQNGEALGTPEYRYGLLVTVLGIQASTQWTDPDCENKERGLEIGGPAGFGYNDLEYKPLGVFSMPRSVIDEFTS
ncbi:hypothetical protein TD95_002776 [Thielaviopsis punctulata]|uniref:Hydantoinase/oxoprolinase N-terminal domain-containing protein n=1 Tax=Thielaviopsis punctulata TaxID=72032 RepID=A0A0F4ZEZ9_9PEZI|nr:hypothetical protein TD95_002776 [Thielaviopsis punctulata]